jgi:hypothetical protein
MESHFWKRRHGSIWELFIDDERKGTVKCKRDNKGNSYFVAYCGGKIIKPKHSSDGTFCSLNGAKLSVQRVCGVNDGCG